MRERQSRRVVEAVSLGPVVDGPVVVELDSDTDDDGREVVLDLSATTEIDGDASVLLAWFAHKLENAGGRLVVTARRSPNDARVTRTLRMGDLTSVLGVSAALDRAILRQLTSGAGGAAPR
jgi:anti-anti-sigma regulatory factor